MDGIQISFLTELLERCTSLAMNILNFNYSCIHTVYSVHHYFSTLPSDCTGPRTLCTTTSSAYQRQQTVMKISIYRFLPIDMINFP